MGSRESYSEDKEQLSRCDWVRQTDMNIINNMTGGSWCHCGRHGGGNGFGRSIVRGQTQTNIDCLLRSTRPGRRTKAVISDAH